MITNNIKALFAISVLAMGFATGAAFGADKAHKVKEANKVEKAKKAKKVRVIGAETAAPSDDAQFCANIKDLARESRYAMKTKKLNELKVSVDERIIALELKRAEFESWQKKREDFASKANATLVDIYSKMKPDAAAARLEKINTILAASIILKLPSRKAGVILNEMKAETAADITQIIAASGGMEKRS